MKEIVIGADGYIGGHLAAMLPSAVTTAWMPVIHPEYSRHRDALMFDLTQRTALPACDVAYLCAGMNGFEACEGNRLSYRTNVDGTIATARQLTRDGVFVVWISSAAVEWSDSAYARQKALVEIALCADCGVVRAGRAVRENVEDLCQTLVRVGRERIAGITLWNVRDEPYWKSK